MGNSLAIPCAYTVLAGVAEEIRRNHFSEANEMVLVADTAATMGEGR